MHLLDTMLLTANLSLAANTSIRDFSMPPNLTRILNLVRNLSLIHKKYIKNSITKCCYGVATVVHRATIVCQYIKKYIKNSITKCCHGIATVLHRASIVLSQHCTVCYSTDTVSSFLLSCLD